WSMSSGPSGPWEFENGSALLYFYGPAYEGDAAFLRENWTGPWMSFEHGAPGSVTACDLTTGECFDDVREP
ncbi:MAG: hypothetical protein M3P18_17865, partial [Actinomycetota bacterium]|nr:hypothetical protein [Actinomycetota bacterium]